MVKTDDVWLCVLQVLSRGIIIQTHSIPLGVSVKTNLQITANMVPSFRVVAYYYTETGEIVADSIWVDVRDECEINVKVGKQNRSDLSETINNTLE